jgi:ParB-like chromosome segregation protein Spo0J
MRYLDIINDRGIKQTWIAKKLGLSRQTLGKYLNGDRTLPIEIEDKLKNFLKIKSKSS